MKKLTKVIAAIMLIIATVCIAGCTKVGNKDVTVTTNAPQNITETSATISGEVEVVAEGITITEKGVCWGASKNPTVSDNHMASDGRGVTVTCTITGLEPGTTYHVRVYATDGSEYYYGTDQSFTTEDNSGDDGGDHAWVDLGLPSGTLWATCNVGANSPEEYGDYFAWGETRAKTYGFSWVNYMWSKGDYDNLTKYCDNPDYGYRGYVDYWRVLFQEDDAATANWGEDWRMPLDNEWEELCKKTTRTWTTQNGVKGQLFTASNGNSLFLPAAGFRYLDQLLHEGLYGYYWSSSIIQEYPYDAWCYIFGSSNYYMVDQYNRFSGRSVRAVRSARQN